MARRRLLRFYFYATYNSVSYDETFTVSSFDATGGTATVTINSSNPWTIEHCPTWLTVTPFYGTKGETNLTLRASENTGQSDLTDTIVFKTNNNQKTITANCTLKGADTPVVSYEVIVNVNNTNLTYSGSTTFNVKLNKTVDGVTTTTDITSTATLTTGGSITVNQNDAIVSGNNSTNYATTGTIKASYTPEGETSAVESTVVTINVAAKPRYSLSVSANPTSIASGASSTLSAVYNTIIEGQTASTQPVTATYEITSGGNYATINGNILNGNNSTSSNQSVVVKGTYNSVTGNTTVTVQAQAIEYTVQISPWNFTGLTSDSGSVSATITTTGGQNWYFQNSEIPDWITITPMTGQNGDSITIAYDSNTGTSTRNSDNIYAYGSQGGNDYLVLSQYGSVAPTLVSIEVEINGNANKIPAAGGSIRYSNAGLDYTVYAVYSDDSRVDVTDNASLSSNTVSASNLGTTEKSETHIGNLYVVATYEGITSPSFDAYKGIYQEANICTVTTTTGKTEEDTVRKRENTRTEYSIDFNPSSISVSSGGGTTSIVVNAISTTTGDIYEYDTWYETSTPHSAYTSGAENDGPTTTATTQTTGDTGVFVDTFTDTATTATTVNEKPSWCTSVSNTTVSNPNSTITYSSNSGSERSGDIIYQIRNHPYEYSSITITQAAGSVTPYLEYITVEITNVPDIPASGGSIDWSAATYTVTAHYSNGDTSGVTSESIITSNTVSASSKGTTVSESNIVGQLTINANYLGLTDDDTIDVSQEANEVVSTWTETARTNEETETTNTSGNTTYSITITPSSANVSSNAGYLSISVVGTKTTPYTATTTTSWDIESTPWSAYTSTASGYGEKTTTHDSTSTQTSDSLLETVGTNLVRIDEVVITGATTSEIYYNQNDSSSSRPGTATYCVTENPRTTGTFTLTQSGSTVQTRNVTINFDDWTFYQRSTSQALLGENLTISIGNTSTSSFVTGSTNLPLETDEESTCSFEDALVITGVTTESTSIGINIALYQGNTNNGTYIPYDGQGRYDLNGMDTINVIGQYGSITCTVDVSSGTSDTVINIGPISFNVS